MTRYILKRLLWLIPVIIGVITIVFAITVLTPGDPAASLLDKNATQEQIDEVHHRLGLDKPVIERWFNYVIGVFTRFDLGTSYTTLQPVRNEVLAKLPYTLALAVASTALGVLFGIPLGVWSALKQYTFADGAILFFSVLFVSMPNFWLSMLMVSLFAVQLGWLPSFGVQTLSGWVMPVAVATIGSMAGIIRITRSSMLEVMRADYIRTARAKGQTEGKIVIHHMMRNAMIPVATSVGSGLGNALGGNMTIEAVFSLPGIGYYIVNMIGSRNYPGMLGGILVTAIMFTIVNLLVDIAYVIIDPRLKSQITGKKASKRQFNKLLRERGVTD
ncbi:MAG TPA: ABC transporter permease [Eubacteriales bacterium]|nr:ABC transporter permease [Clostridia bacterium]HRV73882.1 ABC transporter permease [Eubacteriales bacterium]